jgi:hypothetical protein
VTSPLRKLKLDALCINNPPFLICPYVRHGSPEQQVCQRVISIKQGTWQNLSSDEPRKFHGCDTFLRCIFQRVLKRGQL